MFNNAISIDLGTATILIYIKGKGVVLKEPSVVAVDKRNDKIIAVGKKAYDMMGKTPPYIETVRPLRDGVISSYTLTEAMIKEFLGRVSRRHSFGGYTIMMCVPSGVTDVEQRAVIEAARQMGAKDIYIIEEPIAAALGAGIDISGAHASMVIDIGGGTTDIAIISLGKIVSGRTLKIAGDEFDEAVIRFIRKNYNMNIGPQTAEHLKKTIGCVYPRKQEESAVVRGVGVISGLPKRIVITSEELRPAFDELIYNIVERARETIEETGPEIQSDILKDGIVLTGSGSLIYGLDKVLTEALGVRTYHAQNIQECVVIGAGYAVQNIDKTGNTIKRYYKKAYIQS